jgi:beta-glucosidase
MGRAVVNGLQGDGSQKYDKLHACLKHFAIHSGPEYERHVFDVEQVSWRDLNETYLYAFERLVKTTDVKEIMCAYNAYEGKPCCGSDKLLIKILREQWGFDGMVVTDCWAVHDFFNEGCHNIFPDDPPSATANSVRSGADLECGDSFHTLGEALKAGKITEAEIDRAVFRILKARFELGEMDPEELVSWNSLSRDLLACDQHHDLALQMARETMTLLQNKAKVLPLSKNAKYAVVGPNAADSLVMWGNYNGIPRKTITVLEGITAKVGAENVVYAKGCDLAAASDDAGKYSESEGNYHDEALSMAASQEEVAMDMSIFDNVDAIIYVGGLSPKLEGEEMRVTIDGFKGGDRERIELPEIQGKMLKALKATGKPVVFVLCSGSAVALEQNEADYDALVCAWYGGQAGGTAVGDIVSGKVSPSGRLPITFYKSTAQLPDFLDYNMKGRTYRYMTEAPLYPFGYGLSYADFSFEKGKLSSKSIKAGESVTVTVDLKNNNNVASDEIVQVYVKRLGDKDAPVKALKGFQRVSMKGGEKKSVSIELPADSFEYYDSEADDLVVKPGKYEILYGSSSADADLKALKLTVK